MTNTLRKIALILILLPAGYALSQVTSDAGKDQAVSSKTERVQLHGKASHSFAWTEIIGPPAVIFGDHQLDPWVQLSKDGEYWFMLVVSDGKQIATSIVKIRKGDR